MGQAASDTLLVSSSQRIQFTSQEQSLLLSIANQIQQYQIFETTNIRTVLESIEENASPNLLHWKTELEDSLYTYNEVKFRELLQQI